MVVGYAAENGFQTIAPCPERWDVHAAKVTKCCTWLRVLHRMGVNPDTNAEQTFFHVAHQCYLGKPHPLLSTYGVEPRGPISLHDRIELDIDSTT
jgi:hypothetical protein